MRKIHHLHPRSGEPRIGAAYPREQLGAGSGPDVPARCVHEPSWRLCRPVRHREVSEEL